MTKLMKTKVIDPLLPQEPSDIVPILPLQASAASASLTVTNSSPTTKILQCQQVCAMLLKIGNSYVRIHGDVACPLQVMEKNNSLVLGECLSRLSVATSSSNSFALQTRMVSRDQAGYNKKAERGLIHERQTGQWLPLDFDCEIHGTSRAFTKTYDELLQADITGLLNVALCLRSGSNMVLFRRCLFEECLSKVKIMYGAVPKEAHEYRAAFMKVFLTTGSNLLLNRLLLCKLPNGLWSKKSVIEVFLPHDVGDGVSAGKMASVITSSLCYVLTGSKPHLFARHRWTGCDVAVEELGRLEGIHSLLSSTWARFMAAHSTPSLPAQTGPLEDHRAREEDVSGSVAPGPEPEMGHPTMNINQGGSSSSSSSRHSTRHCCWRR